MSPLPIILIMMSLLFSIYLFYPLMSGVSVKGKKIPSFSGVISNKVQEKPCYLLYIWAPSCGMCRGMTIVIDELIDQRDDIAKINASEYVEVVRSLGILGTPAIVRVENGLIAAVSLGVKSKKNILAMLPNRKG